MGRKSKGQPRDETKRLATVASRFRIARSPRRRSCRARARRSKWPPSTAQSSASTAPIATAMRNKRPGSCSRIRISRIRPRSARNGKRWFISSRRGSCRRPASRGRATKPSRASCLISRRRSTRPRRSLAGAPVRRLTRAAYGNAVRDLLGFPVDVETLLPPDISSNGFDNVSDTLKTSPLLLERYLTVGLRVAAMAVGDTKLGPRATEYRPRLDLSQNDWIEGLPYGTRGGLVVEHYFPTDAEYEIRPELWRATGSTIRGVEGFKTPFEAADPARRCRRSFRRDRRRGGRCALESRHRQRGDASAGAASRAASGERRTASRRRHVRHEELRARAEDPRSGAKQTCRSATMPMAGR